jgi:alpha-glucosidase
MKARNRDLLYPMNPPAARKIIAPPDPNPYIPLQSFITGGAMRLKAILSLALASLLGNGHLAAQEIRVVSPDQSVQFKLFAPNGRLRFAVTRDKTPIIESSPLVLTLDGTEITEGTGIGDVKTYELNEKYPWRGGHSVAVNHCKGATVPVKHAKSNLNYTIEIRAFNDGVAFRYIIPPGMKEMRVPDEATVFVVPDGSTAWYHDLNGHYEGVHEKKAVADAKAGEWAAPPLTIKLPGGGGYASITEAALVNYSGMALQADGHRSFKLVLGHNHPVSYPFRLRYSQEDIDRLSKPAAIKGAITTPWRVTLVGKDLNTLVIADVVHNLCPPPDSTLFPKGFDTEWIRPGRAVWKYMDGGQNSLEGMKEFCRLAGQLGFEHNIVEGFWKKWSDAELKELV